MSVAFKFSRIHSKQSKINTIEGDISLGIFESFSDMITYLRKTLLETMRNSLSHMKQCDDRAFVLEDVLEKEISMLETNEIVVFQKYLNCTFSEPLEDFEDLFFEFDPYADEEDMDILFLYYDFFPTVKTHMSWLTDRSEYGHHAVLVDDSVFFFYGEDATGVCSVGFLDTDTLDIEHICNLPEVISRHGTANLIGDTVYLFGSMAEESKFSSFNVDTFEFSVLDAVPGTRCYHGAVTIDGCLYVIGGQGYADNEWIFYNDVWRYDPKRNKWTEIKIDTMFTPRAAHSATYIGDNKILIFGGGHYEGFQYFNELYIIDLSIKLYPITLR
eukprot:TRINITY_DN6570_c0_g1_i1.p1 TRINITY_DN6570_c0_g1~~TRINITY_DN6570_c0_g1_i1.p1  ORF type:complete len:329 (-),score=60.03 TRINITY_DN6570_c0_g1_i1:515-1501(-)